MEYSKIKFGDITIYKTKLEGINDNLLLNEIYINKKYLFFDREYNDEMLHLPGIQMTTDLLVSDQITFLKKLGFDTTKYIHEQETNDVVYGGLQTSWIYISAPSNPVTKYHDHLLFSQKEKNIPTHFTWIYYVQLPDNCKDYEGHIFFKSPNLGHRDDDEEAYSFFPEQGYLYMWDSEIPHRPALSPNSTLDRVVMAGNVNFNTDTK